MRKYITISEASYVLLVIQTCHLHPCQNGGTCVPKRVDSIHRFVCNCDPPYTGELCEGLTIIILLITARIRRMGKVMFSVCLHLGGYPGQVQTGGGGGVIRPGLDGGGIPWSGPDGGYPSQGWGTPCSEVDYPSPRQEVDYPPVQRGTPPIQRWGTPQIDSR